MKQLKLLATGLFLTSISFGQILKIQTGTSISSLDWNVGNIDMGLNQVKIGYSVFAGLDYFDKKYYNFSSNIGLIRKGGRGEITFLDEFGFPIETMIEKANLDYISINTIVDIKCPIKGKLFPFISLGPRFDYLISYSSEFKGINDIDELKKYNVGLILGGGLKCDLTCIQIGLRADYYLNFMKVADWAAKTGNLGGSISDRTMTINLTFGYRLK